MKGKKGKIDPNCQDYTHLLGAIVKRKRIFTQEDFFKYFLGKIQATERYNTLLMFGYDQAFLNQDYVKEDLIKRVDGLKQFNLRIICGEDEDPKTINELIEKDIFNRVSLKRLDYNIDSEIIRFTIFGCSESSFGEMPLDFVYVWDPDNFSQIPGDEPNIIKRYGFVNDKKFKIALNYFIESWEKPNIGPSNTNLD